MDKSKKKTLTISSDLKKKIDLTSISTSGKKSFLVDKKSPIDQTNLLISHQLQILILTRAKRTLLESL